MLNLKNRLNVLANSTKTVSLGLFDISMPILLILAFVADVAIVAFLVYRMF